MIDNVIICIMRWFLKKRLYFVCFYLIFPAISIVALWMDLDVMVTI